MADHRDLFVQTTKPIHCPNGARSSCVWGSLYWSKGWPPIEIHRMVVHTSTLSDHFSGASHSEKPQNCLFEGACPTILRLPYEIVYWSLILKFPSPFVQDIQDEGGELYDIPEDILQQGIGMGGGTSPPPPPPPDEDPPDEWSDEEI